MPPYPAKRDKVYRWSLILLVVGLTGEALGQFMESRPLEFWMQGWLSVAIVVAGWTFLVWLKEWRWMVRALVVAGLLVWPFWALGGWALSLAATAIMAAKETHCFHFWAGRIIPWYSLALGVGLIIQLPHLMLGLVWLGLAALWLSLVVGRSRLPLFEV